MVVVGVDVVACVVVEELPAPMLREVGVDSCGGSGGGGGGKLGTGRPSCGGLFCSATPASGGGGRTLRIGAAGACGRAEVGGGGDGDELATFKCLFGSSVVPYRISVQFVR